MSNVELEEKIDRLFSDMIADDKKSLDIARALITKKMIEQDEYTDLSNKQVVHLAVLETIAHIFQEPFLLKLCERFKILRKSVNRNDRKEGVKMIQSLKEEQENLQSKLKNLLGVGT